MKIQDYKDYDVFDFVEENYFRKWVLTEDKSLDFFWSAYINRFPHQKDKLEEARSLIQDTHDYFHRQSQDIQIPDIVFKDHISEESRGQIQKAQINLKSKVYKFAVACCLLLPVLGITYSLLFNNDHSQIHYATGHAEWKAITLPDGSKVELNANTQLSLTEEWEEGVTRRVWLKGEAFFKVKKIPDTNVKFTVITKDLEVDVLGTSFNVNTRNDHTEVFLEEGKIKLDMQGEIEQIEPGEFISYSGSSKKIINRFQKTEEIHSNWKDGVLKITDAYMEEILSEVESIYGIDLIVTDKSLLQKIGSVAIPVDDLDMATSILERVLNVKMSRKGKQIFID